MGTTKVDPEATPELCDCGKEMLVRHFRHFQQSARTMTGEPIYYAEGACLSCRIVRPIYVRAELWNAMERRMNDREQRQRG